MNCQIDSICPGKDRGPDVTKYFIKRLLTDCKGGTAIEYGLIVSIVVLGMLVALQAMANENTLSWNTVASKTHEAVTAATAG